MPSGPRILVVDDDPYTRDLAATALRGQGYEVVGAARFQQGLEAARAQRPHLILSDVVLPDGSGVDLARALRHELPEREVPIVVLMSAFSKGRLADQRRMKDEAGAVAFLTKPLSLPAVVDLVQQQLPLSPPPAPAPPDAETAQLMAASNGVEAAAVGVPSALPNAPSPSPARESIGAPHSSSPARASAGAPHSSSPARVLSAEAAAPTPLPARESAGGPHSSSLLLGLANAWRKGWTGTLIVTRQQAEKQIALERGQIVWCTTTLTEERLGRVLLRLGFLPRDQYEQSLKEAGETKRRVGDVLVARGYLTQGQLDDAVVQQLEGIVLGALAWPEGSYRVAAATGRLPGNDRIAVSPVPRLVLRAFREVISGDRLDARLAAAGDTPVARRREVPSAALAQLSPSPEETRFLDALLEPGPVAAQLARHPHGADAAAPYLGTLLALGIVTPSAAPRPATGEPATDHAVRPPARAPATEMLRSAEPKRTAAPPPSSAERSAAESAARGLLEAESAFEAGRSAVERGDLAAANEAILRAIALCPEEGEYRAWAAWIRALGARKAFDEALDAALSDLEQAVALTPSAETIQELIEGVIRLRTLSRDGER